MNCTRAKRSDQEVHMTIARKRVIFIMVTILNLSVARSAWLDTQVKEEMKATDKKKATDATRRTHFSRVEVSVSSADKPVPVDGAMVSVRQDGGFKGECPTNPLGIAKFLDVPYGKTTVQVTAEGYQPYGKDYDFSHEDEKVPVALIKK
jgi:hypothetical protein